MSSVPLQEDPRALVAVAALTEASRVTHTLRYARAKTTRSLSGLETSGDRRKPNAGLCFELRGHEVEEFDGGNKVE